MAINRTFVLLILTANNSLKLKTGGEIIADDEDIADHFNTYSYNIAFKLEEKLSNVISFPFFTLLLITLARSTYVYQSCDNEINNTSIAHRIQNSLRRTSEHIAIIYFQTFNITHNRMVQE